MPSLDPTRPRKMLLELDDSWDAPSVEGSTSIRRIKDAVHDYLSFGPTVCAIIDTPQFQRLRNIKQLGTSCYVWPGASHYRFEHCLGVAYLSQTLAMHLRDSQPSLGISQRDVQCVTIAGLCHDLGHGPWSHVWDSMFIPAILPDKKWCHEDASRMMFDALLEENGLELDVHDATFVKALIMGDRSMCTKEEKPYLFQIVANKTNGLDVDKFDYIARDSHYIDQKSMSLTRLIYSSRVIDDEICYDIKDANQIFELCHTRMSLHKRIYTHKTARAIEYMIIDALTAAEPVMHIARRIENPKKYLYLTDFIATEIESSEDPRLAEAQAILHRIRVRDLYKSVDFKVFPWDFKPLLKTTFTSEAVVKAFKELYADRAHLSSEQAEGLDQVRPEDAADLSAAHVIIDFTERHHGMKNENPLDYMKFYSKHNPNKGVHANEDDISVTLPRSFGELQLRVYTREARFFGIVQCGYREVLRAFNEEQEQERAGRELFAGAAYDPDADDVDMAEAEAAAPVTPPAEAPTTPKVKPRTMSMSRARSHARALSRHASGVEAPTPMKDNPFTKVPPMFNPQQQSPTKRARKREREQENSEDASAVAGTNTGSAAETGAGPGSGTENSAERTVKTGSDKGKEKEKVAQAKAKTNSKAEETKEEEAFGRDPYVGLEIGTDSEDVVVAAAGPGPTTTSSKRSPSRSLRSSPARKKAKS